MAETGQFNLAGKKVLIVTPDTSKLDHLKIQFDRLNAKLEVLDLPTQPPSKNVADAIKNQHPPYNALIIYDPNINKTDGEKTVVELAKICKGIGTSVILVDTCNISKEMQATLGKSGVSKYINRDKIAFNIEDAAEKKALETDEEYKKPTPEEIKLLTAKFIAQRTALTVNEKNTGFSRTDQSKTTDPRTPRKKSE